jgi:hypothetical protein
MRMSLKGRWFLIPALLGSLATCGIQAWSLSPVGGQAGAAAAVSAAAPQQISPQTVVVHLEKTQQFTSAGATKWTASEGVINTAGVFVAPATMPKSATVTISATGPGGTATATVTLVGGPLAAITPSLVHLALGKTQQFVSAGATSWSALYGAVTATGLYTAPKVWAGTGEDVIQIYGAHGSTTARVFFIPPVPAITSIVSGNQVAVGVIPLTVAGTNLTTESEIELNNVPLTTVLSNPDQLRQRVAFALSQIFVTSLNKIIWNTNMVSYQNTLLADAFGNYRQIMEDVTLSPAMGQYLDMGNNARRTQQPAQWPMRTTPAN